MELALGTVQFGLRYGVAGRDTPVPEAEVREILARAFKLGIRMLDTAAAYGDIEARLPKLAGDLPFRIVTKLPPMPAEMTARDATTWAGQMLDQAHRRLGKRLDAVMFHRADDLLGPQADTLLEGCAAWAHERTCRIGVSCYDPDTLRRLARRLSVSGS